MLIMSTFKECLNVKSLKTDQTELFMNQFILERDVHGV